jgi:hypothetical protein
MTSRKASPYLHGTSSELADIRNFFRDLDRVLA